jgi:hypothetical protein
MSSDDFGARGGFCPKRRDEVAWARETDPPGDLRDREIGVREQALGLQAKVHQELVRGPSRNDA